jgi:hypothetical protein
VPVVPVVPDAAPGSISFAPYLLGGLVVLLIAGLAVHQLSRRRPRVAAEPEVAVTPEAVVPQETVVARDTVVLEPPVVRVRKPVVPVVPVVPVAPVVPVSPLAPALSVADVRDVMQHGYAFVEGVVRNVSDRTLRDVEVVVDWAAATGELFTRETALINMDALAPGGVSPFKVLTRANPSMTTYSLVFLSEGATLARFRPTHLQ